MSVNHQWLYRTLFSACLGLSVTFAVSTSLCSPHRCYSWVPWPCTSAHTTRNGVTHAIKLEMSRADCIRPKHFYNPYTHLTYCQYCDEYCLCRSETVFLVQSACGHSLKKQKKQKTEQEILNRISVIWHLDILSPSEGQEKMAVGFRCINLKAWLSASLSFTWSLPTWWGFSHKHTLTKTPPHTQSVNSQCKFMTEVTVE